MTGRYFSFQDAPASASPSNKRKHDDVFPSVDKEQAEGEAQKKVALVSATAPDAVAVRNSAGED